jgi:hypothetical protein
MVSPKDQRRVSASAAQVQVSGPSCRNPLDKNQNARQLEAMNFDRFAGLFAASAICLTLAIVTWSGVAGPIWRATDGATPDQWLGFAGSLIGALATLAAGLIALLAAFKTLAPIRAQLDQLVKQNDHVLYDRMRRRATDLNEEIILIQQVCGGVAAVDRDLRDYLGGGVTARLASERFETALDGFNNFVAGAPGDVDH